MKRLLFFALEATVFVFGIILTFVVAALIDPSFAFLAFATGLLVTAGCVIVIRKRTRRFKIKYEAANWMSNRSIRQLHPTRIKYLRLLRRCLVWLPTLCAAFVLIFFPVASHIVNPHSHFLTHYRVPIPLTFMVFSSSPGPPEAYSVVDALGSSGGVGRIGITPFWDREYVPSLMVFGSVGPSGSVEESDREWKSRRAGASQLSNRIIQLRGVELTCWRYLQPERRATRFWLGHVYDDLPLWEITCETPIEVRDRDFYGLFDGRIEDIPAFYEVLQNVTLTD